LSEKFKTWLNLTAEEIKEHNGSGPVTIMVFIETLQVNNIYIHLEEYFTCTPIHLQMPLSGRFWINKGCQPK